MILKKLIVHNYKQHAHREEDLSGNVIGVVGPNGSGKSNLLGALQFAFAGEQPGFNKQDLLRWGTDSGRVELFFEHNGVEAHLARSLHSAHAKLEYGDEDPCTGAQKVAARISDLLGLDRDLMRQAIFVRQAHIDSILFEDPRVRELSFQKLCGIGDAAKIHKKLGEELTTLSVPPNYDEQIADGKQRYEDMHSRLKQLQTTAAAAQQQREKCPNTQDIQAQLTGYTQMLGTLEQYGAALITLNDHEGNVERTKAELQAIAAPDVKLSDLDKQLDDTRGLLVVAEKYQRLLQEFEQSGKALMELGDKPQETEAPQAAQLDELMKAANDLSKRYQEAENNFQLYEGLLKAVRELTAGAECPVCGNQITDAGRLARKAQEARAAMDATNPADAKEKYRQAALAVNNHREACARAITEYEARHKGLMERYQQAEGALDAVEKIKRTVPELNTQISELEATRKVVIDAATQRTTLTTRIEASEKEITRLKQQLQALKQNIAVLPDVGNALEKDNVADAEDQVKQQIQQFQTALQEAQQLDQQLAQLRGMIQELEANTKSLEKTIATLEYKRSQLGTYQEVLKTLNETRDWFHYSNGPHTLATSVLADMTQDVNDFLGQFAAPFSVQHGEDVLGFNCLFHDGRQMPSSGPPNAVHISGGEKIQLAISFRFASYCMFANKLGLLSLDEPTVYLDDNNVGRFCTLLGKIKEVAQKMNLQVLIATHERAVMPFMDTVIDLRSDTVTSE